MRGFPPPSATHNKCKRNRTGLPPIINITLIGCGACPLPPQRTSNDGATVKIPPNNKHYHCRVRGLPRPPQRTSNDGATVKKAPIINITIVGCGACPRPPQRTTYDGPNKMDCPCAASFIYQIKTRNNCDSPPIFLITTSFVQISYLYPVQGAIFLDQ